MPQDRQAHILITTTLNNGSILQAMSDTFTILQQPTITPIPLSLTVTSPNGGEVIQTGQTYKITWDASSTISSVNIIAISEYDLPTVLANGISNTGSFDWKVAPSFLLNTRYKIAITGIDQNANNVTDDSDNYFTIVHPSPTPTATPTPTNTPTIIPTATPMVTPTDSPKSTPSPAPHAPYFKGVLNKVIESCVKIVENENKINLHDFLISKTHVKLH